MQLVVFLLAWFLFTGPLRSMGTASTDSGPNVTVNNPPQQQGPTINVTPPPVNVNPPANNGGGTAPQAPAKNP